MAAEELNYRELLAEEAWLRGLARHLIQDESLVEDFIQEVWLKAIQSLREMRNRRAWLATVLRRRILQHYRNQGRVIKVGQATTIGEIPCVGPRPEELIAREEVRRKLFDEVMALAEPYRQVVLLQYYEDLSQRRIARELGIPLATVRSRLFRARECLREQLQEKDDRGSSRFAALPLLIARPSRMALVGVTRSAWHLGRSLFVGAGLACAAVAAFWLAPPPPPPAPGVGPGDTFSAAGLAADLPPDLGANTLRQAEGRSPAAAHEPPRLTLEGRAVLGPEGGQGVQPAPAAGVWLQVRVSASPEPGAQILHEEDVQTDSGGMFSIDLPPPPQTARLTVVPHPLDGLPHRTSSLETVLSPGQIPELPSPLPVYPPDEPIEVRVVDAQGAPVAQAWVRTFGEPVLTDGRGFARLPGSSYLRTVGIHAWAGDLTCARQVVTGAGSSANSTVLTLAPCRAGEGTIGDPTGGEPTPEVLALSTIHREEANELEAFPELEVTVIDSDDQPIAGAHLIVGHSSFDARRLEGHTRVDGSCLLQGAPLGGDVQLLIQCPGFAPELIDDLQGLASLEVALGKGVRVRGRVRDPLNRPVARARLQARYGDWDLDASAVTDPGGEFILRDLPSEGLTLQVFGEHLLGREIPLEELYRSKGEVEVKRACQFQAQVLDAETRAPVQDFLVRLSSPEAGGARFSGTTWREDGVRFRNGWFDSGSTNLTPGLLSVTVSAPGYRPRTQTWELGPQTSDELRSFELEPDRH